MIKQDYVYNAYVVEVYDGDSITVDIDLGFYVTLKDQKIRLAGIDAPELRLEERDAGILSREWLREKILNKNVVLVTYKDKKEKYGRWLADVYLGDIHINNLMLDEGMAVRYVTTS